MEIRYKIISFNTQHQISEKDIILILTLQIREVKSWKGILRGVTQLINSRARLKP